MIKLNDNKNIILIVGNFEFPDKNAAGKRVLGLGFIFKEIGFKPIFIGIDKSIKINTNILDKKQNSYGFSAYSMPYPKGFSGWLNFHKPYTQTMQVMNEIGIDNIAGFLAYGNPSISILMNKYRKFCRAKGIYFIADCVDWIQFSNRGFVHNIIKYLDTNFQKRYVIAKADLVIAISRYLYKFYKSKDCNVIEVPPVSNTKLKKDKINAEMHLLLSQIKECKKTFIYGGTPFGISSKITPDKFKDRLDRSVEMFYQLFQNTKDFIFNIYGITKKDYLIVLPQHESMLNEMRNHVVFHGSVPIEELEQHIIRSDFSVLHRDDNLVTKAGFPTKVSESISLGTPVITEPTSNIIDYIIDGENGYIINAENELEKLREIVKLNKTEILKMKQKCLERPPFDYRLFMLKLTFLHDTIFC